MTTKRATLLSGISPDHCFPDCPPEYFCQLCETDIVAIAACDPDIGEVVAVDARVIVQDFRTLTNVFGKKVVVQGVKVIEAVVTSCGVRYITSAHIPFCAMVCIDGAQDRVAGVKVICEDVDFRQMSSRCIAVSIVFVLVPVFHSCHNPDAIRCDIRLDNRPQPGGLSKWTPPR